MPERIRLSRQKGWRMPPNTVKVDRSTRWGNPFGSTQMFHPFLHHGLPAPLIGLLSPPTLERCIDMFTARIHALLERDPGFLTPLEGKNLACWCALDQHCHADVLLRLANPRRANRQVLE